MNVVRVFVKTGQGYQVQSVVIGAQARANVGREPTLPVAPKTGKKPAAPVSSQSLYLNGDPIPTAQSLRRVGMYACRVPSLCR